LESPVVFLPEYSTSGWYYFRGWLPNAYKKNGNIIVSRLLKAEKDRAQMSFLECGEYAYFFVTNTDLSFEEVDNFYQKRGNSKNYIKEVKYDMSFSHLLLKSFWSN